MSITSRCALERPIEIARGAWWRGRTSAKSASLTGGGIARQISLRRDERPVSAGCERDEPVEPVEPTAAAPGGQIADTSTPSVDAGAAREQPRGGTGGSKNTVACGAKRSSAVDRRRGLPAESANALGSSLPRNAQGRTRPAIRSLPTNATRSGSPGRRRRRRGRCGRPRLLIGSGTIAAAPGAEPLRMSDWQERITQRDGAGDPGRARAALPICRAADPGRRAVGGPRLRQRRGGRRRARRAPGHASGAGGPRRAGRRPRRARARAARARPAIAADLDEHLRISSASATPSPRSARRPW